MESLDDRIDRVCWRLSTRLSQSRVPDNDASGNIVAYFDTHTKLCDIAKFHRDFIRMQGGNEEAVYRALCFVEEAVLTPYSGTDRGTEWVYFSLHILLSVVYPHRRLGCTALTFLDDLNAGIEKMRGLGGTDDAED